MPRIGVGARASGLNDACGPDTTGHHPHATPGG